MFNALFPLSVVSGNFLKLSIVLDISREMVSKCMTDITEHKNFLYSSGNRFPARERKQNEETICKSKVSINISAAPNSHTHIPECVRGARHLCRPSEHIYYANDMVCRAQIAVTYLNDTDFLKCYAYTFPA